MRATAMTERDVHLEGTLAEVFAVPLCDDEDEPVAAAYEPEQRDSSDEDVEAHGGGGFNRPE